MKNRGIKVLFAIGLLILANIKSFSQANTVTAKTINATLNLYLSGSRLDSISTDGLFTFGSNFVIPTQGAIKAFVNGKITTFTAAGDVTGTSSGAFSLTPTLVIQPLAVTNAKIANSTIAIGKFANGPANNYLGFDNLGFPTYIPPDTLILRTLGTGTLPILPISRNVIGVRSHRDSLGFHSVINSDSSETWYVNNGLTNPMTALGQMIYGGASGVPTATAVPAHAGMRMVWNGTLWLPTDTASAGSGITQIKARAPLVTVGADSIKLSLPTGRIAIGNLSGNAIDTAFVTDVFNMPEIKTYVPAQGVSASNVVTNYSATTVDTSYAYFTSTPLGGTDGGGVLFNSVSGDSINLLMPFGVFIGHSIAAGHPGHVSNLEVGGWTPNYPDSFGTITYALDSLTHFKWYPMGIGGQNSTQIRARFMRDAIGLNSNPNDGRTTLTIGRKPSFILLDGYINDYATLVPDSISQSNYIWMAQTAMQYQIPLIITTSVGDGSITSQANARKVSRFNTWLKSGILNQYGVTIVDTYKSWATIEEDVTKYSSLVAPDKIHYTKAGYNTIGIQIFNEAKLPVLTKIALIHGNSATAPLTNWNRPTGITFLGVPYTLTNSVYDTIAVNFFVPDTAGLKVTSSVNVSGSSVNTGFNTVKAFFDNNPGNQIWYTKKQSFRGATVTDLDVSTLKITAQSYTNGMKLMTVLANDNTYHYFDIIGNPGGSSAYFNFGASALTAINSAAFNVGGGIAATGAIYTTNPNSQFGQMQIGNTANPGTGFGLGIISSGINLQYGAAASQTGSGFTIQKWNTNTPTWPVNASFAQLNIISGVGALSDRDSAFAIKIISPYNNTATSVLPGFVGGIHYQPVLTALGTARHLSMWMETGDNLFNTVSGKTAVGTFNPSGSSKFDVTSTTQGAIFPRMSTAQRDSMGYISAINVTSGGSGYGGTYPTVTVSGGSGTGVVAFANISVGVVTTVQVISPGIQFFGSAPTVAFGGPGTGAAATAVVHGPDNGTIIYNTTLDSLQYYNGTKWLSMGVSGTAGINTIGPFSGSSQINGAGISGSTLTFGPADPTNPGMVTTGSQTFAGAKTNNGQVNFNGGVTLSAATAIDANYTVGSETFVKLVTITADRVATLPSASSFTGRLLKITNYNTASFKWTCTPSFVDGNGSGVPLGYLVNGATYNLHSDGSNWVLDAVQYPTSQILVPGTATVGGGSSTTMNNGLTTILFDPGSVIAAYTLTLPSNPPDGAIVKIHSGGAITGTSVVVTSFTVSPNSGQTIMQKSAPTTLLANDCLIYQYSIGTNRWYREQ